MFGASNHYWLGYDVPRALEYMRDMKAKTIGTQLHAFAADAIKYRAPLSGRGTLAMYVNDCIKYGMDPEIMLKFSNNFFGTADAITVDRGKLRISDLKTGVKHTPHMNQLLIYDALYCLDYGVDPKDIDHELKIYFKNDKITLKPKAADIYTVIDKMKMIDAAISERAEEESWLL